MPPTSELQLVKIALLPAFTSFNGGIFYPNRNTLLHTGHHTDEVWRSSSSYTPHKSVSRTHSTHLLTFLAAASFHPISVFDHSYLLCPDLSTSSTLQLTPHGPNKYHLPKIAPVADLAQYLGQLLCSLQSSSDTMDLFNSLTKVLHSRNYLLCRLSILFVS